MSETREEMFKRCFNKEANIAKGLTTLEVIARHEVLEDLHTEIKSRIFALDAELIERRKK